MIKPGLEMLRASGGPQADAYGRRPFLLGAPLLLAILRYRVSMGSSQTTSGILRLEIPILDHMGSKKLLYHQNSRYVVKSWALSEVRLITLKWACERSLGLLSLLAGLQDRWPP